MEIDAYEHGVHSWVDLSTPDPDRAIEFYSALFGWDVHKAPPEAGEYGMAYLRDRPVAGIAGQQQPGPTVWATYVNVDDADAVAAKVAPAGGQVFMDPGDVLDVGRMGMFADPAGAAIGMWQPGTHKGAGIVNEPGSLTWNELVTSDVAGSKAFYAQVFGWDAESYGDVDAGGYTEWKLAGRSIGGMMAKRPDMPAEMPSHWAVYFSVEDTDATLTRVQELGGTLIHPPTDIEPGRFAIFADPTGGVFQVLAMRDHA